MRNKPAQRFRRGEIVKVAVVLGCWLGGLILRFRSPPASYVGGGLLIAGCVLLAYWARAARNTVS